MSHDKWNVVCVLEESDRAIFVWDNPSLEQGIQSLRHDVFIKLSKLRGGFYV